MPLESRAFMVIGSPPISISGCLLNPDYPIGFLKSRTKPCSSEKGMILVLCLLTLHFTTYSPGETSQPENKSTRNIGKVCKCCTRDMHPCWPLPQTWERCRCR